MTAPSPATPDPIAAAIDRLWDRFLPEIESRVATVADAASALALGTLTAEQRRNAHETAHKLAGSLGTFGLERGTELARQTEWALAEDAVSVPAEELVAWTAELKALIRNRS